VVNWSGLLYRCDNGKLSRTVAKLDPHTPEFMRAPGAVWGLYALECAVDELAFKAGIDPIELRLKNYTEKDQIENKPFSIKEIRACYRLGAEGLGEIGIVGVAAAIANAVFHATGKRIRDLPITLDKLL
jgi:xanthine dehydrogenase YagR molybdenum-binding subunit